MTLQPVYTKELEHVLNMFLQRSIKDVQPKAIAAQTQIRKDYIHAIVLSFTIIGIVTFCLIVVHAWIIYSNPNIKVHLNKIAYSVMYSIGFIIVIEISFFLLITKNLKTVSSEELQLIILSSFQRSLAQNGLSLHIIS
jgi:heme/copper-type cytochrome/quinol oxidase subunit 2